MEHEKKYKDMTHLHEVNEHSECDVKKSVDKASLDHPKKVKL